MIYFHNFQLTLVQYFERGRANDFPQPDCCPICGAVNRMQRHGFYERNALQMEEVYRIPICRLQCPDCRKTISILPDFLIPYFQHTFEYILHILLAYWAASPLTCSRQLRRFYEKRTYSRLVDIELFFRDLACREILPPRPKEKAIKLFRMILDLGKSTFTRRWWGHRVTSFMAHSLYHGARVARTETCFHIGFSSS